MQSEVHLITGDALQALAGASTLCNPIKDSQPLPCIFLYIIFRKNFGYFFIPLEIIEEVDKLYLARIYVALIDAKPVAVAAGNVFENKSTPFYV